MSDAEVSTALAVRRPALISGYNPPPEEAEFRSMIYMAKQLAEAQGFVPAHFYREPSKILAAMLYGRDLGITPTNALQHIIVIEGKATADAQLIGMLVRRAGHRLEDKTDANSSTVTLTRADDGSVHTFTFTMQDATRANLAGKGAWKSYPQAMLYARALTGCARKGAQDALMGVAYTPEELGAEVLDGAGNVRVLQPTGEIPAMQALPAAPGVSEAAVVSPPPVTVIQPTPPAPSEGQAEPTIPPSGSATGNGAGTEAPAAPVVVAAPAPQTPVAVMPLSGPALQRRMGAGRSIGPAARRTNVVTVEPQAAETPATALAALEQPTPRADPVPSQPAPPALIDEPVSAPPVEDGLAGNRQLLREAAAELAHVNAILRNKLEHALKNEPVEVVPPATPTSASDEGLARLIDRDYPGRTLSNLGEAELQNRLELVEANLAKKREVMTERGISEE